MKVDLYGISRCELREDEVQESHMPCWVPNKQRMDWHQLQSRWEDDVSILAILTIWWRVQQMLQVLLKASKYQGKGKCLKVAGPKEKTRHESTPGKVVIDSVVMVVWYNWPSTAAPVLSSSDLAAWYEVFLGEVVRRIEIVPSVTYLDGRELVE